MIRTFMALLILVGSAPMYAGLWDSDRPTPDDLTSTFDVISGRFPRMPAGFYERRFERVNAQLHDLPKISDELTGDETTTLRDALPLYDAAAIALFRLQRYGEAIIILDRKFLAIEAVRIEHPVEARTHEFRMLANKSECLKHRWLHSSRADQSDLTQAKRLLDRVIEADGFNTDAAWSLAEIDWLLSQPRWDKDSGPVFSNMLGLGAAAFRGSLSADALVFHRVAGCIEFLSRRVAYEQGWDNVDVMYALCLGLELSGRRQEAVFAYYRVIELLDTKAQSIVSHELDTPGLKNRLAWALGPVEETTEQREAYDALRSAVKTWQQSRMDYLESRLKAGQHPDVETSFWSAWSPTDDGPPKPGETTEEPEPLISTTVILTSVGALLFVLAMIFVGTAMLGRGKAGHPTLDEI